MTQANGQYAIDLHHVEKTYRGKVRALRGVNLTVHSGEIFGLLGPNGAGKSTLVKILMTVVSPSRIEGSMLGHPIGHKSTLARVGYLPEHHRIPPYLTGRQALEFYGALAKVSRHDRKKRSKELLQLVGMSDWADKKVSSYSKGMMQRVGLAQSLINDPDLIVLDEPTDGVDPVGRREIRDVLLKLRAKGKTIFLNSHLLSELEMVCDRVAILMLGKVVQQGTIDDLTAHSRRYEIVIEGQAPKAIESVDNEIQIGSVDSSKSRLMISKDDPNVVQPLIDQLRKHGVTIISIRPVRESLEELFLRAVSESRATGAKHVGAALGRKGQEES